MRLTIPNRNVVFRHITVTSNTYHYCQQSVENDNISFFPPHDEPP